MSRVAWIRPASRGPGGLPRTAPTLPRIVALRGPIPHRRCRERTACCATANARPMVSRNAQEVPTIPNRSQTFRTASSGAIVDVPPAEPEEVSPYELRGSRSMEPKLAGCRDAEPVARATPNRSADPAAGETLSMESSRSSHARMIFKTKATFVLPITIETFCPAEIS